MKVSLQENKNQISTISVDISPDDYLEDFKKELKKYAHNRSIKGFRSNNFAIRSFIQGKYGAVVRKDTVLAMCYKEAYKYIQANQVVLKKYLEPDKEVLGKINFAQNDPFRIVFICKGVQIFPVPLNKDIDVNTYKVVKITDKYVKEYIEYMRGLYKKRYSVDQVKAKDMIYGLIKDERGKQQDIDFEVTEALSKKLNIIGKKLDETIRVDLKTMLAFPSVFTRFMEQAKNAKEGVAITLNNIVRTKLPKVDQAFYDTIFGEGNVTSKAMFESSMRKKAQEAANREAHDILYHKVRDVLVSQATKHLEKHQVNKKYAWQTILKKYAEDYQLDVSNEEILRQLTFYYRYILEQQSVTKNMDKLLIQRIEKDFKNPLGKHVEIREYLLEEALLEEIKKHGTTQEQEIDTTRLAKLKKIYNV